MAITREDVVHVAKLARLELAESEVEPMRVDLEKIIGYMAQLNELDTSAVPPTAQVAVQAAPLREDAVQPGFSNDAAMAEAPRHAGDAFAVPAFVEE
ncbi:MAG TPA: Asp-tRNA(Asn)/Glu-tRNA(Gln) amidotransferase subunit GatC [Polyangiaceae bacterium]|nr:Asp-tRNA(Asn)/Glu-tRNA(Gln) amidotransferase subunit GatC [Polyangiaceae bacterium]